MGGKSRKTGGISKKLIDRIKNSPKAQDASRSDKKQCGTQKKKLVDLSDKK